MDSQREIPKDKMAEMFRLLYAIREFETTCISLYRKGEIRGYFHPYLGEEAIAVGVCSALRVSDYIVSTHRGHGHCIAKGAKIHEMIAELFGKKTGCCRGMGGSMHIADAGTRNLGANGIVGGGIPIGIGAGLSIKIKGDDDLVVIFTSDGAVGNGVFFESLNMAALWKLPVVFVIENNRYAASTPVEEASAIGEMKKFGELVDIFSCSVDGNNVGEVYRQADEAAAHCRDGKGPALIEALTYRHQGHHVNDPGDYMPRETLQFYKSEKDPVANGRSAALKCLGEKKILQIESEVRATIEKAVSFARESEIPDLADFLAETDSAL